MLRRRTDGNHRLGHEGRSLALKTPPGTSVSTIYRDNRADPPQLVCQVGSARLGYHARALEDLHAWLKEQGDWVPLGAADQSKEAAPGTVEA